MVKRPEGAKPAPAAQKANTPSPMLMENIRILKEETNFFKFNNSPVPIDKIVAKIETPFYRFRLNAARHFMRRDKVSGKYNATILNSKRAAFLWFVPAERYIVS